MGDDVRPSGTREARCAMPGCIWVFWVDMLDPRTPDQLFCVDHMKPEERMKIEEGMKALQQEQPPKILPFRKPKPDLKRHDVPAGPDGQPMTGLFGDVPAAGRFSGPKWRVETTEGAGVFLTLELDDGGACCFQIGKDEGQSIVNMLAYHFVTKGSGPA